MKFYPGCEPLYTFWALFELLIYAFVKSYPACELLCTSLALFELLTCLYKNLSRMQVHLLGYVLIADMSLSNHLVCGLPCIFWTLFELLTCFYEILSSLWVAVHCLGSIYIADIPL
jgi:hypothetical protein